jgi:hypothetical protein
MGKPSKSNSFETRVKFSNIAWAPSIRSNGSRPESTVTLCTNIQTPVFDTDWIELNCESGIFKCVSHLILGKQTQVVEFGEILDLAAIRDQIMKRVRRSLSVLSTFKYPANF